MKTLSRMLKKMSKKSMYYLFYFSLHSARYCFTNSLYIMVTFINLTSLPLWQWPGLNTGNSDDENPGNNDDTILSFKSFTLLMGRMIVRHCKKIIVDSLNGDHFCVYFMLDWCNRERGKLTSVTYSLLSIK